MVTTELRNKSFIIYILRLICTSGIIMVNILVYGVYNMFNSGQKGHSDIQNKIEKSRWGNEKSFLSLQFSKILPWVGVEYLKWKIVMVTSIHLWLVLFYDDILSLIPMINNFFWSIIWSKLNYSFSYLLI